MRVKNLSNDSVKGMVYGAALGDAWGYVTEFKTMKQIEKLSVYGVVPPPRLLVISDDTQMHLRTMEAVFEHYDILASLDTDKILATGELQDEDTLFFQNTYPGYQMFGDKYLEFFVDPLNVRAPGSTCMSALELFQNGYYHNNYSLGCGTVMRAPWLGALTYDRRKVAALSSIQADVTHGDPKGWIISALSSDIVRTLLTDDSAVQSQNDNPLWLWQIALDSLYEMRSWQSEELFPEWAIQDVRADILVLMSDDRLATLAESDGDICEIFGEGWIADEALYGALGIANAYPLLPIDGLNRAVRTSGDSDSIASLAGSFLGAIAGFSGLDNCLPKFSERFEDVYKPQLDGLVQRLLAQ